MITVQNYSIPTKFLMKQINSHIILTMTFNYNSTVIQNPSTEHDMKAARLVLQTAS